MSKELFSVLNKEVANFSVLYEKLHHYHWYVEGGPFFTLHEKFQEDYEEITEYVDELAERLIQIGGKPISSMKQYIETATLDENQSETGSAESMVVQLVADYRQLVDELQTGIDEAGKAEDSVTEDLFIGISASFQKKIWLYQAFLGKPVLSKS